MLIRDLQEARLLNPIIKIAVAATIAGAVVFLTDAAPTNAPRGHKRTAVSCER